MGVIKKVAMEDIPKTDDLRAALVYSVAELKEEQALEIVQARIRA